MAKIAQVRFPDPPDQYNPRPFAELIRQLEQVILQLNSSYQEDNKNEVLRRLNFLQGDGAGQSGIDLSDLSVSTGSASGGGTLSYNNSTGAFTFAPAVTANRTNQIIQTVKTDTATVTTNPFADIPGMSVSITPTATSSKVFITGVVSISVDTTSEPLCAIRIMRDSTEIGVSTGASSTNTTALFDTDFGDDSQIERGMMHIPLNFLDSPSTTSATTYKVQGTTFNTGSLLLNRRGVNDTVRTISSITAQDVLQ